MTYKLNYIFRHLSLPLFLFLPPRSASHISWRLINHPSSHFSQQEMALGRLTPDDLVNCLTWRPTCILESMITIVPNRIQSTVLPRTLASLPMGYLDTLPIELLHMIFNSSDFQSLSRLTQVCLQAKLMVESLLSYRRLMKHASTALNALSRTRLIKFHAAATLHAALLSDKCVSCQNFAAFLFLPTCERCCYDCLRRERFLRVIEPSMAKFCFGLSQKNVDQLPTMLSIPGKYRVGSHVERHRYPVRLVNLEEAETLGISIHGSQEAMLDAGILRDDPSVRGDKPEVLNLSEDQICQGQWIAGLISAGDLHDEFFGVASIRFPSLRPNGKVEHGLWCGGCRIKPDEDGLIHVGEILKSMYRARSQSEFLQHVRDCKGAREILWEPVRLRNTGDIGSSRRSSG